MATKPITITTAAIVVVLALTAAVFWFIPVLRVSSVEISGTERVAEASILDDSAIQEGDNLLRIDASGAAARIAKQPWVRGVTVSRHLPSTVEIEITEREVVGFIEHDDGPHLIDHQGHAFFIDTPPDEAVEISGAIEDEGAVNAAVSAIATIPAEMRRDIASVEVKASHAMELRLHDGRTIYWGVDEINEQKAAALEHVLHRDGEHWDISNPGLVTVR